ncbi:MAG: phosphodiester glycosidase family protein [Sandaracinus sp.]
MARWLLALVLSCFACLPGSAHAQQQARRPRVVSDVWQEPAIGVRYLRRLTSTPTQIHVVIADLRTEGVELLATPHADRWATVPEFAADHGLEVAINGGFWSTLQDPRGLAAGGGELWPDVVPDPEFGTFFVDHEGVASIASEALPPEVDDLAQAVSGRPVLLLEGELSPTLEVFPDARIRAPRTAVGVGDRGRRIFLVVVDGRQRDSRGMSLPELAELFLELGADSALNLDGGGSSEMFVRGSGGVVNVPSRGRWEIAVDELLGTGESTRATARGTEVFVRGREREVMNHLGLRARRQDVAVAAHASPVGGLVPIDAPPPLPPRVRVGPFRETLARIIAVAAPGLALLIVVAIGRRVLRAWRDRSARRAAR